MFAKLLLNRIEKQTKPAVRFIPKRCLRSRLSRYTCDVCLSQCEKQAITLSGRSISFREDLCTGCMACVTACPNDAFACDFDLASVFKALQGDKTSEPVVLSCHITYHHANHISIPCIGLFSEPLLAALNCAAQQDFFLDIHRCPGCDNAHQLKVIQERVQGIICKGGQKDVIKMHYLTDKRQGTGDIGLQRRSFLRAATKSFMDLGREVSADCLPDKKIEPIGMEEKGPVLVSRILQMTFDMQQTGDNFEKKLLLSYFSTVTANQACNLCPSCAGMCPTGALKRNSIDGVKKLAFTSAKCSGCGLCRDFCKNQALTLQQGCKYDPGYTLTISQ